MKDTEMGTTSAPEQTLVDTVDWCTIGVCNLRCPHCYGPAKTLRSLSFERMLAMVGRMVQMGVRRVVFSGGEPLLTPRIFEIMAELKKHHVEIALSTNGSFVMRDWEKICELVDSLNIPLDGETAEIHARSRNDESTFRTNIEIVRRYSKAKVRPRLLRVGTVFSAANCHSLEGMAKLLTPYADHISTWKIYEIINDELQIDERRHMLNPEISLMKAVRGLQQDPSIASILSKAMVATANDRDRAYFMINPKGELVVPTHFGGITRDVVVGNFVSDPVVSLVVSWMKHVNSSNYKNNHAGHYTK